MKTRLSRSTRSTRVSPGIWCSRWASPFESAIGLLEKYWWANFIPSPRVALGSHPFQYTFSYPEHVIHGTPVRNADLCIPPTLPLVAGFAESYAREWGWLLINSREFRFCPSCLDIGFHSIFYQLDGIARCPIHFENLIIFCIHCAAPVTIMNLLNRRTCVGPFECPSCKQSISHKNDPNEWSTAEAKRTLVHDRLEPVARWLRALNSFSVTTDLKPRFPQTTMLGTWKEHSAAVTFTKFARQLVEIGLPTACLAESYAPIVYTRLILNSRGNKDPNDAEICLRRAALFKSIRRYVLRTYLQRHRRCISNAAQCIGTVYYSHEPLTTHFAANCVLAGAYVQWLKRYRWNPGKRSMWTAPPPYFFFTGIEKEDSIWAWNALCDFYSCAAVALACSEIFRSLSVHQAGHALRTSIDGDSLDIEHNHRQLVAVKLRALDNESSEWLVAAPSPELLSAAASHCYPKFTSETQAEEPLFGKELLDKVAKNLMHELHNVVRLDGFDSALKQQN